MITYVRVHGFRSLSGTELTIQPGLNVIVGPNGSGKSNILEFLQFLGKFASESLDEAMSQVGGAGSAFQKISGSDYATRINVTVLGKILNPHSQGRLRSSPSYLFYHYAVEISLSDTNDDFFIEHESLKFSHISRASKYWISIDPMDLTAKDWQYEIYRDKQTKTLKLSQSAQLRPQMKSMRQRFEKNLTYRSHFIDSSETRKYSIFAYTYYQFWQLREIAWDFQFGEIYDIDPKIAREPQDAAQPPGVQRDGRGLAATLYYMQKHKDDLETHTRATRFRSPYHDVEPFDIAELVALVRLANDSIVNVRIGREAFANTINILFEMDGFEAFEIPATFVSEGTIKWVALLAAVLSGADILGIEEPENFLHPAMQHELVRILRTEFEERNRPLFITTHSESLLNACAISDLVVCHMHHGITECRRVENQKVLIDEMKRTGFGVGHLYMSGIVDNASSVSR